MGEYLRIEAKDDEIDIITMNSILSFIVAATKIKRHGAQAFDIM